MHKFNTNVFSKEVLLPTEKIFEIKNWCHYSELKKVLNSHIKKMTFNNIIFCESWDSLIHFHWRLKKSSLWNCGKTRCGGVTRVPMKGRTKQQMGEKNQVGALNEVTAPGKLGGGGTEWRSACPRQMGGDEVCPQVTESLILPLYTKWQYQWKIFWKKFNVLAWGEGEVILLKRKFFNL